MELEDDLKNIVDAKRVGEKLTLIRTTVARRSSKYDWPLATPCKLVHHPDPDRRNYRSGVVGGEGPGRSTWTR